MLSKIFCWEIFHFTVFIFCHGLKFIPNVYEIHQEIKHEDLAHNWPDWIEYISSTSHLLIALNASADVFIYFLKHRSAPSYVSVETGLDNIIEDSLWYNCLNKGIGVETTDYARKSWICSWFLFPKIMSFQRISWKIPLILRTRQFCVQSVECPWEP